MPIRTAARRRSSARSTAARRDTARPPSRPDVAVLDAALELFEQRTYAGTAVPAVAARAGVAVGSVYRYFPGKEALANAVFRRAKSDLLAAVRAEVAAVPVDGSAGGSVVVAAWWRGLTRFAQEQPAALAFLEHQQHATYLDATSRAVSDAVEEAALAVVRAGQEAGEIRAAPPEVLLALAFGAFVGLTKAAREAGRVLTDAEVGAGGDAVWAMLAHPRDRTGTAPATGDRSTHQETRR
jgi:TetR/AcrR family transcriptional regulator, repressor of fatR-cypB operon